MKNLLLLICLITFFNCNIEKVTITSPTEFDEYIQDEMDDQNIPAVSAIIFKEGDILYENYYGQSNIDQDIDLENDHLFLMASVSKVVTATALLQLVDAGLCQLDDQINDYLSFEVNPPNQSEKITLRMLLTHTSGIADGSALDDQYYYDEDSPIALKYFLENYLVSGGDFYNASENFHNTQPGSLYEYSNIGNALIGLLVQEITNIDFADYCKTNIFDKLGMSNTYWHLEGISETIVTPYNYENNDYKALQHYTFTDYPNGGLRSTSRDMFKFLSAFTQDGQSNNFQLLEKDTIELMSTPQIPSIDNEVGLHLFLMNSANKLWGHDGGEEGVSTIMAFNKETKVGAIILTNQSDVILDDILAEAYKYGLTL